MDSLKKEVKENIGSKRYEHSVRVADLAVKLAEEYNIDSNRAYIAGLLHDCGKYMDKDKFLKEANKFDIIIRKENEAIVHGKLGARLAEEKYGITDPEILNSITYHTVGRVGMSQLEKIVFLADYIEPMRNFSGIEEIRDLAFSNLNLAILKAMDQTVNHLIRKGAYISIETIETRNYILGLVRRD